MKKYIDIPAQQLEIHSESEKHYSVDSGSLEKITIDQIGTVIEIPEWKSGITLLDIDGDEVTFIGQSATSKLHAVIATQRAGVTVYLDMRWDELCQKMEGDDPS